MSIQDSRLLIKQNYDKYDVFVAVGGDGTVHTVARELIGSEKVLGVLPVGSGNGFANEFRFRKKIRSLLNDINNGEYLSIDTFEINGHLCLNVAGVGLDSIVAHSFDKLRTRGFWTYVWVTFKSIFRLKPIHVVIKSSGKVIASEDVFVLTVANTRQFGHNAYIARDAVPNDGIVDIVMIRPFPKYLSPLLVFRLFTKKLKESKYVHYLKTAEEVIIQTSENRIHVDGEAVLMTGDVAVKIKRNALKVLKTARNNHFWSTGS